MRAAKKSSLTYPTRHINNIDRLVYGQGHANQQYVKQGCPRAVALFFTLFFMLLLFSQVSYALGAAPSRRVISYEQQVQAYSFRLLNNQHKDIDIRLSVKGELADYITIAEDFVRLSSAESEKEIFYTLSLPAQEYMPYGTSKVSIVAVELPLASLSGEDSVVVSSTAIEHQVHVNVPYPGIYADGSFYVSDFGSEKLFTVSLVNLGSQSFSANADISVTDLDGNEIAKLSTEKVWVEPGKTGKLLAQWDPSGLDYGEYFANSLAYYNANTLGLSIAFPVGSPVLSIRSISTAGFLLGTVARFDLDLDSNWNKPIENVYATFRIFDSNQRVVAEFDSLPASIPAQGSGVGGLLQGYWDTADVNKGEYMLKIINYYAGKKEESLFVLIVDSDKIIVLTLEEAEALKREMPSKAALTPVLKSGDVLIIILIFLVLLAANPFLIRFVRRRFGKGLK